MRWPSAPASTSWWSASTTSWTASRCRSPMGLSRSLLLPDDLVVAAGVAVDDAVRRGAVLDVEVEPPAGLAALRDRSVGEAVDRVDLQDRVRRAVGGAGVEVADVRSGAAVHRLGAHLGAPDAVVVTTGLQILDGEVDGPALTLNLLRSAERHD